MSHPTKAQLIAELTALRQRVTELEGLATQSGRAEEALRELHEREQFLSELFASIQDGISILDPDLNVIRVNPTMERWYAHALPLTGKKCYEAYHGRQQPCPICPSAKTLHTGEAAYEVVAKVGPDGTIVGWFDLYSFPFVDRTTGQLKGVIEYVRDITARKQAEESLHLQNAALEAAANGIVITDQEGTILWVNPAFTHLTGYTSQEALGQNPRLLKSNRHDQAFYQKMWETILAGEVWHGDLINRRKDGSLYTEEMTITPVRDEHGEISHFIAIKQDITRRKQVEQELQAQRDFALQVMNAMGQGLTVTDAEGRFEFVNPAYARLVGRAPEELIGHKPADFTLTEDHPVLDHAHAQRQAGQNSTYETRLQRPDGSIIPVLITGVPRWRAGQVVGAIAVITDLTERKQAEMALQASEQRLTSIVETIPNGITITDCNGQITFANPAAERILGLTRSAITQRTCNDPGWKITTADGKPFSDEELPFSRVMRSGQPVYGVEYAIERPDQTRAILSINAAPLRDRTGQIEGVVIALTDITERKRAEQERQQRLYELATINAISQAAASQLELNALLKLVGERLYQSFNIDGVYVSLYDPATNTLHFPYMNVCGQLQTVAPVTPAGGLTAMIFRSRQPLLINENYEQRRIELGGVRIPSPENVYPKAWLGVPILIGEEAIGTLSVQNFTQENVFTEDDVRLLMTIAANLGIAIRNAQLYDETRRRAEQLETLRQISLLLTSNLNIDHVLRTLHKQCQQVVPIDCFYVALYDETTHGIHLPLLYQDGQYRTGQLRDSCMQPELTDYVIQTRQTLYLPDTLDADRPPPATLPPSESTPIRTYVGVPLLLRDRVVGAISMQSYQPNAYTPDQIRLLEMVATQTAIVVENARLYAEVQQLAITDELTGLLNRRALFYWGEREMSRARRFGRPLSVILFDIDHFKQVNDTYTHLKGDQVLRALANCCRHHLRSTDIASRYGGDEFLLILPEVDLNTTTQVAERLREQVAHMDVRLEEGKTIWVTISLGVATLDAHTTDFHALVEHADQAMYRAKQCGRNRVEVWRGK